MAFFSRRRITLLAGLLIFSGLGLLAAIVLEARQQLIAKIHEDERIAFDKATNAIEDKVLSYVHGLQGMSGVYLTNDFNPHPQKVRDYAVYRHFFTNFEGSIGFGFIRHVTAEGLRAFVARRKTLDPRFTFSSLRGPEAPDHYVIEVIEPYERNKAALGLDIGSEALRRRAAEHARRTGLVTLTAPIKLVQTQKSVTGFLFFLPLYTDLSSSPDKIGAKDRTFVGLSYTPFTLEGLLHSLDKIISNDLVLEIHDSETGPFLRSSAAVHRHYRERANWLRTSINVGSRRWNVFGAFRPTKAFLSIDLLAVCIFLALGCLHIIAVIHYLKVRIAKDDTDQKNILMEGWLRAVLDGSDYSIISTDTHGTITTFNKRAERILGFTADEMIGKQTPAVFHDADEVVARAAQLTRELGTPVAPGFETFVALPGRHKTDIQRWTYVNKNGHRTPVRLCVTAITNNQQ